MFKKECLYCKKEFETNNKRKKYCSHNCCVYFNRKEKVKTCKNCRKPFKTKSTNRVHCSDECRSKYKRNELFVEDNNIYKNGFNEINSYIFGLIMSDGSLVFDNHSKRERIIISSNDYDILNKIKDYCGITRKIYNNRTGYNLVYINQEAINFLKQYGLDYRKSKIISLPKLPEKYMSHFIRGYFDGDGSILTQKNKFGVYQQIKFTTGSQKFANELNRYFISLNFSSYIYNHKASYKGNYYIIISKTEHIRKFYRYIYNNCGNWYLERKKIKFIYK